MSSAVSPRRRHDVLAALRRGTVPASGLDLLAVGLSDLEPTFDHELRAAQAGGSGFKAVRGEYGAGKTFLARWLGERAKADGMAVAEVQISETETPLHRLETVYRRLCERLSTVTAPPSAFRPVLDSWLFALEDDVLARDAASADDPAGLDRAVEQLLEQRLGELTRTTPAYAAALRGYRRAVAEGDVDTADGLAAWLAGHPGLLLVLDEVETLQRVRSDARAKAFNALRQLIDEVDGGRFPGLYLLVTGTPAFFEGRQGVQLLPPLAQRLHADFATDARFDNPRAPQVRLPGFDHDRLVELGVRVRDLFASGSSAPERVHSVVDDAYLSTLASAVAGGLGGRVGVAPRLFLRKLVADVLDRVEQFGDFDPRQHYALTVNDTELTDVERQAARSPDDVDLDV